MRKLIYRHHLLIDILVYVFILMHTVLQVLSFDFENASEGVIVSFALVGLISFVSLVRHDVCIDIYSSVFVFSYVFMFLAPLEQYCEKVILWSNRGLSLSYSDSDYLFANCLVILNLLLFNVSYHRNSRKKRQDKSETKKLSIGGRKLCILLIISFGAILYLFATGNISGEISPTELIDPLTAQMQNILRYLPVCSFILYMLYIKEYNLNANKWFVTLMFSIIFILFFPTNGLVARFLLFGTYIAILSIYFSRYRHKSFFFLLMYLGFCYGFSNTRYMTSFSNLLNVKTDFSHVDFDAYQIYLATINYTDTHGIVFGKNILSALLFLVPRSIWQGKMIGTGTIAATALGSYQENVSACIWAELYTAFGSLGVIIGGFLLGYLVCNVDKWALSKNLLKKSLYCILLGMTIYIVRGSLLSSIAFTGGLVLSMLFVFYICRIRLVK